MSSRQFVISFIFLCLPTLAAADQVDDLLAAYPGATAAILVKDLETGKELYGRNAKQLMIPASVTKSFTAYAALAYLGPNFTYDTQLLEANGKVYFKFSGDPSFTRENLKMLLAKLPKQQLGSTIVVDDSVFDQKQIAAGWVWEDGKFCYGAPISAVIVDGNCFAATLKANGMVQSSNVFAIVRNELTAKNDASCSPDLRVNPDNSYDLTGCVDRGGEDTPLRIAYQNPRLMIKAMIRDVLGQKVKVSFKKAPAAHRVIASHKSKPLAELVKKMQKDSDNLYANSLAKTIGARYYKTQGSFENGVRAIKEITQFEDMLMVDGSGNSRYNLISPEELVKLSMRAYNDKKIWPYFHDSLAISAVDGSLGGRFAEHQELHGEIHAKSGGMKGVTTLSGYLGHNKAFAVMINGFTASAVEMRKLMDAITKAVLSY